MYTEPSVTAPDIKKVTFILKTTAIPARIATGQLLANQAQLWVSDICERLGGAE